MPNALMQHVALAGSRVRIVLIGLLVAGLALAGGAGQARAATPPVLVISPTDTLQTVVPAVQAVASGTSIELLQPGTLTLDNRNVCALVVTVGLFGLSSAVIAYLATAGVAVTVLGVAIGADALATLALGAVNWSTVYTWAQANVCATAGASTPAPTPAPAG